MVRVGSVEYRTIGDISEETGLSRQTVQRYIRNHKLKEPKGLNYGLRTVKVYSDAQFKRVIEQIRELREVGVMPDPPPKNPPPPKKKGSR